MRLHRLPSGAVLALGRAVHGPAGLLEGEESAARLYTGERLAQYCSGRVLARRLMMELGLPPAPVGRREDGAPIWPAGCVGALSHSGERVGALLGHSGDWLGLGLDVERIGRIGPELWPTLFGRLERRWLAGLASAQQQVAATACFGLKEAFLKLPADRCRRDLNALELTDLEVGVIDGSYRLRDHKGLVRRLFGRNTLRGEVWREDGFLVAALLVSD